MIEISKFSELNENINTILEAIINNQDLCKLIYYTSPTPLEEPLISNPNQTLLFENIIPYPIVPTPVDSEKTLLTIILDDFSSEKDSSFKNSRIVFNVICHIGLWKISGRKLRPYSILSELDKVFNNQRIIGIGKLEFERCRWISVNEKFQGYQLVYKVYEFN